MRERKKRRREKEIHRERRGIEGKANECHKTSTFPPADPAESTDRGGIIQLMDICSSGLLDSTAPLDTTAALTTGRVRLGKRDTVEDSGKTHTHTHTLARGHTLQKDSTGWSTEGGRTPSLLSAD